MLAISRVLRFFHTLGGKDGFQTLASAAERSSWLDVLFHVGFARIGGLATSKNR
jgi:hypothetical protein